MGALFIVIMLVLSWVLEYQYQYTDKREEKLVSTHTHTFLFWSNN